MPDAALSPVEQRFVLHWGEMGTRWGINRTVAQIHALLYLSDHPLPADEIASTLGVARSNVSTSLRELQSWGIVKLVHVLGDRRDHFESLQDVWDLFRVILKERRRREIDPTIDVLRECVAEAKSAPRLDAHPRAQLTALLGFLETMTGWYNQIEKLPTDAVIRFVKLGPRLGKLLGGGRKRS